MSLMQLEVLKYHSSNSETTSSRIKCNKFWIYGARCHWTGNCTMTFNYVKSRNIGYENTPTNHRKEKVLLYESADMPTIENFITFHDIAKK